MKFKTAYDPAEEHDHCGIEFTMPSLTVQDEKDETGINYIVNKYADGQKGIMTLDLGDSSQYAYLQFGDATLPGDYSTALELVSLTQNLSLGTYLPSLPINQLFNAVLHLNGGSRDPGSSSSLKNMFGFSRSDASFKLLSYLGYGNIVKDLPSSGNRWWSTSLEYDSSLPGSQYTQRYIQNNFVTLFPLLTYQKIYQDFFR